MTSGADLFPDHPLSSRELPWRELAEPWTEEDSDRAEALGAPVVTVQQAADYGKWLDDWLSVFAWKFGPDMPVEARQALQYVGYSTATP